MIPHLDHHLNSTDAAGVTDPDVAFTVETGLALLLHYATQEIASTRPKDPKLRLIEILRRGYVVLPSLTEVVMFLRSATRVEPQFLLQTLQASLPHYLSFAQPRLRPLLACTEEVADILLRVHGRGITKLRSYMESNRQDYSMPLHAAVRLAYSKHKLQSLSLRPTLAIVAFLKDSDNRRLASDEDGGVLQAKIRQLEWLIGGSPIKIKYRLILVCPPAVRGPLEGQVAAPSMSADIDVGLIARRIAAEWHPCGAEGIEVVGVAEGQTQLAAGISAASNYLTGMGTTPADGLIFIQRELSLSFHLGEIGPALFELVEAPTAPPPAEATTTAVKADAPTKKSTVSEKKAVAPPPPQPTCAVIYSRRHVESIVTLPADETFYNKELRMPDAIPAEKLYLHVARQLFGPTALPAGIDDVEAPMVACKLGTVDAEAITSELPSGLGMAYEVASAGLRKLKQPVLVYPCLWTEVPDARQMEPTAVDIQNLASVSMRYAVKKERDELDDAFKTVADLTQSRWERRLGDVPDGIANARPSDLAQGKGTMMLSEI
eukprot:PhM_4_TR13891/c0_g1_i1/m.36215